MVRSLLLRAVTLVLVLLSVSADRLRPQRNGRYNEKSGLDDEWSDLRAWERSLEGSFAWEDADQRRQQRSSPGGPQSQSFLEMGYQTKARKEGVAPGRLECSCRFINEGEDSTLVSNAENE